jgi:hypothetical protein
MGFILAGSKTPINVRLGSCPKTTSFSHHCPDCWYVTEYFVRVLPEHHQLLRRIGRALATRPELSESLTP